MAAPNRFQTRVSILAEKPSLTNEEIRLNSLLEQAQIYLNKVNHLQRVTKDHYLLQQSKTDAWSSHMYQKIDDLYKLCLNDLNQSCEQLKIFQRLMDNILSNEYEHNLDVNKLLAIAQEIRILKCLTYQLDISKVKIDKNIKSGKCFESDEYDMSINDNNDHRNQNKATEGHSSANVICRILVHKDVFDEIKNLPLFQENVQITSDEIDETTPERVLIINNPKHLEVIEKLLFSIDSLSSNHCELRMLLHQSYAPIILGKLGDRAKVLREKYSLHTLTIHPTCAPHSTERVLLIQSSSPEKIVACLDEIFTNISQNSYNEDDILYYDESNYDATLAHEYGGFASSEPIIRSNEQHHEINEKVEEDMRDDGIRRYSALDAWNGSVEADTEHELTVVKLGDDSIIREFWINHGQFGALLGPHGVRIAQIRSQCRTVRIHTVAGSSIDTCSVKVIGPRSDVNHAVNLIMQSIKEHDRKFPFKHHRFSGRLR